MQRICRAPENGKELSICFEAIELDPKDAKVGTLLG